MFGADLQTIVEVVESLALRDGTCAFKECQLGQNLEVLLRLVSAFNNQNSLSSRRLMVNGIYGECMKFLVD